MNEEQLRLQAVIIHKGIILSEILTLREQLGLETSHEEVAEMKTYYIQGLRILRSELQDQLEAVNS